MKAYILPLLGIIGCATLWVKADNPKQFVQPLSARTSSYDIQLSLDTVAKQVQAQQRLIFTNPSADTIRTMPFHMYYNAFKNNRTSFLTEASSIPRSKSEEDIANCNWSWIRVESVEDSRGNDLSASMRYIQPDNDNTDDHTVLSITLAEPILPYATDTFDMVWQSQIPKLMVRTGYNRDFYFMAQWYPKLGVYEAAGTRFAQKGQWNCHQYHAATEYYGEFGVYRVAIEVPSSYKVGASGFLVSEEKKANTTVYTYLAEDVIDFTWTANPRFVEIIEHWKGIHLKLLIMPEHTCNKDRFLEAAKNTLSFYENYLEKYPYPMLTIVSPPYYGLMAGAMEYPTLITAPTLCGLPAGLKVTETLTIHELTHQYFMQMLATNEQEEPWMDEGFTAFFEAKILDKYYPEGTVSWNYMGINIASQDLRRGRFFNADNIKVNPISDVGWDFKHGSYSEIVYGKTAVWLRTLEGLLGEAKMQAIMQTYFSRWKFKHPGRQDFIDVVHEEVGKLQDSTVSAMVDQFLTQAIYGTDECDYAVKSISNEKIQNPLGYFASTENCDTIQQQSVVQYQSKVVLFRLGEFIVPQDVLVTFDDGETVLEHWDGQGRSTEFVYTSKRQVVSAQLDPELKIPLDKNLINNSYTNRPDKTGLWRYVVSFVTWLQQIMLTLSTLV